MTTLTLSYDKQIGTERFSIYHGVLETVREARGFRRPISAEIRAYHINGKRVARAVWFARKDAAREAQS